MNLIRGGLPYFLLPLILSALLVPVCKHIGFRLGIYAVENKRTVHHGHIVRMGGVAIFIAFFASLAILWTADDTLNGILLGSTIIFVGGLLDDIYDLSPKKKLLFQFAGAITAMTVGGVKLDALHIFSLDITSPIITNLISFLWIVGVTNAINLIDGLDGLSSGICTIVTLTIGLLGFFMGRRDVCILALTLAGAILGFLPYNFHPASIFVGDCGAQFMGFTIACMSLLGFKTTAIITLGLPMLVLFVPISDTLIAMLRRKLKGQGMFQADKGHLHHILMIKLQLGHRLTVIVLYIVTALFASAAILTYFKPKAGMAVILILLLFSDLFVEFTGMINPKWHPILSMLNKMFGWPQMKQGEDPVDTAYLLGEMDAESEEQEAGKKEEPADAKTPEQK
jgi:UDP-GlcNAc:undecaprenyl-phosphate GlcNAc-1-phosphate transferase